jgi:hypothetical protein
MRRTPSNYRCSPPPKPTHLPPYHRRLRKGHMAALRFLATVYLFNRAGEMSSRPVCVCASAAGQAIYPAMYFPL